MPVLTACAAGVAAAAATALAAGLLSRRRTLRRAARVAGAPGAGPAGRAAAFVDGLLRRHLSARGTARRRAQAERDLDDVLMEVAESLRAGESLVQALQRTASSARGIWKQLLSDVLDHYDQGLPLPDAVRALDGLGSRHITLFVRAIQIHQRTGGDLAEVLLRLAETVRDQRLFEGEIRARTAESRWTAYFVAATPFLLLAYFLAAAPAMLFPLLAHPAGRIGLAYALASWAAGLAVLRRLVRFTS